MKTKTKTKPSEKPAPKAPSAPKEKPLIEQAIDFLQAHQQFELAAAVHKVL